MQPEGPYYLGGYSMGGLIACEMARRLRAAGETVGLLALLDTYPRDGRRRFRGSGWLARDGNSLADRRPASVARYVLRGLRFAALAGRAALWRGLFGAAWRLCERSGAALPRWLFHPTAASLLALRRHRMTPYDGDALLFAAERYSWERDDVLESWRGFISGRLTVHAVPGEHHTFLEEPHVHVVARLLRDALEASQRRPAREDLAAAG